MTIYDIIQTRRSIRSFLDTPVPDDVLNRILNAARFAPSGSNRQPSRLIVIHDREQRKSLVPMCANQDFISKAPLIIVGVGKTIHFNRGNYMGDYAILMDVTIVMDHLMLAARYEGLGSCWIGAFDNAALKAFLHIPEGWNIIGLTPIGYPKGDLFTATEDRIPLESFTMKETWV